MSRLVGRVNQQSKGETPLMSGVLQRAAVRAVAEKEGEATEDAESGKLRESRFRHDFSQVGIDRGGWPPIQAKLTIGAPNDKYEQEADRVASQVVQQINAPASIQSSQGQSVQRTEAPEESEIPAKHDNTSLQRMEEIAGGEASTDLDTAINSARSSGQPLEAGLQRSMGQAMGADFRGVRVHTDAQSEQLNQSIQAKAFTTGQDVFFRQGAYEPGSRGGQELIAHELTHVVQQNGGAVQRASLPLHQVPQHYIQRAIISAEEVPGMRGNMDTTDFNNSLKLIEALWGAGQRASLATIYQKIKESLIQEKNKTGEKLVQIIYDILKKQSKEDSESKTNDIPSEMDKINTTYPDIKTLDKKVKSGLRLWIYGDSGNGIAWKTIGMYLQGRLPQEDINRIGDNFYYFKEPRDKDGQWVGYWVVHDGDRDKKGRELLKEAVGQIKGALDALPGHEGTSYRQADVMDGSVYGGKIKIGDHIMDKSFWSTSAIKMDGSAGKWGTDGTEKKPRVYFILTGKTGKYISKAAEAEKGQHEVLYKDRSVFRVEKMASYKKSFFVHVTEVDPKSIANGTPLKNPFTGEVQVTGEVQE